MALHPMLRDKLYLIATQGHAGNQNFRDLIMVKLNWLMSWVVIEIEIPNH
jgi:hypothetical protein